MTFTSDHNFHKYGNTRSTEEVGLNKEGDKQQDVLQYNCFVCVLER